MRLGVGEITEVVSVHTFNLPRYILDPIIFALDELVLQSIEERRELERKKSGKTA